MDALYDEGIRLILYLQKSWSSWDNEMLFLSKFGDPRNNFLIYFPIFYHWSAELGVSVLWTAVISEWFNLVLKWILQGERPYWWVHESSKWMNVTLKQYELTCETGPGSPSGHAMVTSAVFCLVVLWFTQSLRENVQHQSKEQEWKDFGPNPVQHPILRSTGFAIKRRRLDTETKSEENSNFHQLLKLWTQENPEIIG
ncbi:PREDICTED: glucose-6-phosphatase 2-like [Acropora digitifera]|uniref:glucose-6-phosphatase 2-like n=1 Tax=Acropora digitifera TaxID=70779 RepID=UPI00077A3316|nr:PREDICTED: glucose-6-phosphatase 2-like [Acropora digitifera]